MTRTIFGLLTLCLCAAALQAQDPKAAKLRELNERYQDQLTVLTWVTKTSAMGQNSETEGSAAGILLGDSGLFMVSNQVFGGSLSGMAGMFGGRGSAPTNENFKLHSRDGKEYAAVQASEDAVVNLRFFGARHGGKGVAFPEKAEVPALGEEVVILGVHDATLNFARFFRVARINAVVEDGKYYGLDGSVADCLGALVVTWEGKLIGIVGQKPGKAEAGGGGLGRILGGLSDPAKALGNRVLMTPAVFAEAIKTAEAKVKTAGFFDGAVLPDQPVTPVPATSSFDGAVASARWREKTKDQWVLVDVRGGEIPAKGSKLAVVDAAGKTITELSVVEHYNQDPLNASSPVEQLGCSVPDADNKLKIEKGAKVIVVPPSNQGQPARSSTFRGIDRFLKMDPAVLKENFGGVAAGYQVAQIPDRDSAARTAGIKNGDVIIKVGETEVTPEMDLEAFTKLLKDAKGEVTLTVVRRGGEKIEIKVAE
jgi:hypothetical protein